jgi:hypothetical protein
MSADSVIEIIKQVGFPAAVAFWFMFRTDRRLDKLTEAIHTLAEKRR